VDVGSADRAGLRLSFETSVPVPASRVFEGLAGEPANWERWFRVVRACRYDGEPPYGVGTVRLLRLHGGVVARERVLRWDELAGTFAYRVDEANVPGLDAMVEMWTTTPGSDRSTRVQWVIAADGTRPVKALLRAARTATERVSRGAMRRLTQEYEGR
jgi:hypothetical protein